MGLKSNAYMFQLVDLSRNSFKLGWSRFGNLTKSRRGRLAFLKSFFLVCLYSDDAHLSLSLNSTICWAWKKAPREAWHRLLALKNPFLLGSSAFVMLGVEISTFVWFACLKFGFFFFFKLDSKEIGSRDQEPILYFHIIRTSELIVGPSSLYSYPLNFISRAHSHLMRIGTHLLIQEIYCRPFISLYGFLEVFFFFFLR